MPASLAAANRRDIRKHNQLGAYRAFGNLDVGRVAALGEPSSVVRYAAHEWDTHRSTRRYPHDSVGPRVFVPLAEALQAIREIAVGMELEIQ